MLYKESPLRLQADISDVKDMCMCTRNWPLPIGAFQDQCKQIVINIEPVAGFCWIYDYICFQKTMDFILGQ